MLKNQKNNQDPAYEIFLILLVFVLFISGCAQFNNSPGQNPAAEISLNILTPFTYENIRWNHMPLTVFINANSVPTNWKPSYKEDFIEAMEQIEKSTDGLIRFQVVETPDSDIIVKWVSSLPPGSEDAVGNANLDFVKGKVYIIKKAEIQLLTEFEGRSLTSNEMKSTALHELGHALGLAHSEDANSAMYPKTHSVLSFSENDLKALREVYSVRPLPDLAILNISFSKRTEGKVYYLDGNITIANQGYLSANNVNFTITAVNETLDTQVIKKIEAGEIFTYKFKNAHAKGDFNSVALRLDPDNEIEEISEENNAEEMKLYTN